MDRINAEDCLRFARVVEAELMSLHEGNFARYQIRPSEFVAWRAVRELSAAGIVTVRVAGRTRWLQMKGTAAETWARASMLAEPQWPIHAISAAQWKAATQTVIEILSEPVPGAWEWEWELWRYSPALVPESETVDPLSLSLSLQDHTDERVQLALDELRGHFPW